MINKVGYYQKPFGTNSIDVELSKVLSGIRGNKFKTVIDEARKLYGENKHEEYTLLKNTLPALTFSGTFTPSRSTANLSSYSNILVLDIDHIGDRLPTVRNDLTNNPYVIAVWLSPSGDGLKFLIASPANELEHKAVYKQAAEYFDGILDICIDKSGSDVSRLCFISHDPEIYVNKDFLIFDKYLPGQAEIDEKKSAPASKVLTFPSPSNTTNYDSAAKVLCRKIYHFLEKRKLSITGNYIDWVRVAFSISNTFPPSHGIDIFLDFCRLDGSGHDEIESERLIHNCYQKGSATSTFKTIIFLAQEKGYQLDFNEKNNRRRKK